MTVSVEHLRETPVDRTPVFAGRLLSVYRDTVRLANGELAEREIVTHRGAVGIVAVAGDGVVMVRQWRHAVGKALWEIPAGTRDQKGESPEQTAVRELAEETGYHAARWTGLGRGAVSPGYSGEELWLYRADDLTPGVAGGDPDEIIDVAIMAPRDVVALAHDGGTDLKTIAALTLAGVLEQ